MRASFLRLRSGLIRVPAVRGGIVAAASAALVLLSAASGPASASASAAAEPSASPPPALTAFEHAWDGVTGYRATVSVYSQKGADAQHIVFDYTFHKPSSFTVHVVAGPNAGVTLSWDGGPTVQASRGGGIFAALLKRTIPLHDPLVTTIRGASLDQLSYGAILAHAEQTPGELAQTPGEPIAGTPTQTLSLVPAEPAADAGLSREVIAISSATQLPIEIEGYDGSTLVSKIDFSDIQPEK